MADIKQALKDYVATTNSGKYDNQDELMSKFPELQGHDTESLNDFVATYNSGKYATDEELFSKFPEFSLKKKEESESSSNAETLGSSLDSEGKSFTSVTDNQEMVGDSESSRGSLQSKLDKAKKDIRNKGNWRQSVKKLQSNEDVLKSSKEKLIKSTSKEQDITAVSKSKAAGSSIESVNEGNKIVEDILKTKLPEYREQTKLTPDEKYDTEQQLYETKNNVGVWNTITSNLGATFNYVTKGEFQYNDPLDDYKKRAKQYLYEQNGFDFTQQDVDSKADELFKDEINTDKKQQKINDFVGGLDDTTKTILEVDSDRTLKSIDKQRGGIYSRISLNKKYAELLIDDLSKGNVSKENMPYVQDELLKITSYIDKDIKEFNSSSKKLGTAEDELKAFSRNYNVVDNITGRIGAGIAELGLKGLSFLGMASSSNPMGGAAFDLQAQVKVHELRDKVDLFRNTLRPDNKNLSASNFIQSTLDLISGSAADVAVTSTGLGGVAIIGAGEAGRTYNDMFISNMNGKTKYTPSQMTWAPLVNGISTAGLMALPTLRTLSASKNVIQAALLDKAEKESLGLMITNTSKNIIKHYGINIPTMVADNTVHNWVKRDWLGDKNVNYFDGNEKALKDAAYMTTIFSTIPHIGAFGIKMFSNKAVSNKLDNNGRRINELLSSLDDKNIDESTKDILKQEISKLTVESSKIIDKKISDIGKLSDKEVKKVVDNHKKIDSLIKQAEVVKEDKNISQDQTKEILDSLKNEASEYSKDNHEIIKLSEERQSAPIEEVSPEEKKIPKEGEVITNKEEVVTPKEEVIKEKPISKEKVSDDYVSLSNEIKSIEDKVSKTQNETRKQRLEEQKTELESKRNDLVNANPEIGKISKNIDKIIKELGIEKNPCNI